MGVLKARFLGTVDADVDPRGIRKTRPDGTPGWGGRIANVSGRFYVGSLMLDAIDAGTGEYPEQLDPPVPNEDYLELHNVALITSFDDGRDTEMSGSFVGLKAGDKVSFLCNLVVEPLDRGHSMNVRPTEAISVIARSNIGAGRRSRVASLTESLNGKK